MNLAFMDFKKRPKEHMNKSVENIGGCSQVEHDDVSFASTGDYCTISSILITILICIILS